MSKRNTLYYDRFVWSDFRQDMDGHPIDVIGAWMMILCVLWESETRGRTVLTLLEWSNHINLTPQDAESVLRYIKWRKIGDIEADIIPEEVSQMVSQKTVAKDVALSSAARSHLVRNRTVTPETDPYLTQEIDVACRRMVRDEKVRKNAAQRAADHRYRERQKKAQEEALSHESNATVTKTSQDKYIIDSNIIDNKLPICANATNGKDPDKVLSPEQFSLFNRFWKAWPNKKDKLKAKKAFKKLPASEELTNTIIENVNHRLQNDRKWIKDDGEFIPYPSTYLNGHRWKDEPDKEVRFEF